MVSAKHKRKFTAAVALAAVCIYRNDTICKVKTGKCYPDIYRAFESENDRS